MEPRFVLVTEANAAADTLHWRVSAVAPSPERLPSHHDGYVVMIPRNPADRRIASVTVTHYTSGVEEPAGIYALA
jgi:hypothetical protein